VRILPRRFEGGGGFEQRSPLVRVQVFRLCVPTQPLDQVSHCHPPLYLQTHRGLRTCDSSDPPAFWPLGAIPCSTALERFLPACTGQEPGTHRQKIRVRSNSRV